MVDTEVDSIHIRRAKKADISSLVNFNLLMARETENKKLIPDVVLKGVKNLLDYPQLGFYIVVENNGEIIASLMITSEWSDWRNGSFWWIQSVYVIAQYRGKSVYRRLYDYVKDLANKDQHVCGFRLYVEKNNKVAQQTYTKVGMSETDYMIFEELKPGVKYCG